MRVFWLFNHPAPYKVSLWNCLGKKCELTVFIERSSEAGRNAIFYGTKAANFKAIFGKPLPLGGFNSWSREPIKYLANAKEDYDVVVLNGWRTFTEMHAISFCKKHHIPYVFAINGGIKKDKEGRFAKKMKCRYIGGAPYYLSPEPNSSDYLIHYGANPENITLFPYGSASHGEVLSTPCPQNQKERLRRKLGIEGAKVFVSSGQLIERKNYEQLIRLWAKMPEDHTLYIAGEGKQEPRLAKLIEELGLKNVFLLGYLNREAQFSYFRAADCFVLLSKEDIYGHVIIEAFSQGLPVVASDKMNAAKGFIENGKNGMVVTLEDEDKILEALNNCGSYDPWTCLETAKRLTFEASAEFHYEYFKKLMEESK